jgi:hypothetical protein
LPHTSPPLPRAYFTCRCREDHTRVYATLRALGIIQNYHGCPTSAVAVCRRRRRHCLLTFALTWKAWSIGRRQTVSPWSAHNNAPWKARRDLVFRGGGWAFIFRRRGRVSLQAAGNERHFSANASAPPLRSPSRFHSACIALFSLPPPVYRVNSLGVAAGISLRWKTVTARVTLRSRRQALFAQRKHGSENGIWRASSSGRPFYAGADAARCRNMLLPGACDMATVAGERRGQATENIVLARRLTAERPFGRSVHLFCLC